VTQLPITFEAALRDAEVVDLKARTLALTHLGSAYLERLGRSEPLWRAHTHDDRGPEVLAALLRAIERDPAPPIRALAATGLGQLGAPELLTAVPDEWFTRSDAEAAYQRECAAIGWTLLGQAAKPVSGDEAQDTYDAVIARLREGLRADQPELRFQCAAGLAELEGRAAEDDLVAALARETTPQIRGALVTALGELDPPGPRACEVLAPLCDEPDKPTAFAAALALTAARDPRGGQQLLAALGRPLDRGRALEALAALGPLAPPAALPNVRRLARSFFTPGLTRVRAAYALARLAPAEGEAVLARLAGSLRVAVREAVADARAGLTQLAKRDREALADPMRRPPT
jgi:HEAT repeat protein